MSPPRTFFSFAVFGNRMHIWHCLFLFCQPHRSQNEGLLLLCWPGSLATAKNAYKPKCFVIPTYRQICSTIFVLPTLLVDFFSASLLIHYVIDFYSPKCHLWPDSLPRVSLPSDLWTSAALGIYLICWHQAGFGGLSAIILILVLLPQLPLQLQLLLLIFLAIVSSCSAFCNFIAVDFSFLATHTRIVQPCFSYIYTIFYCFSFRLPTKKKINIRKKLIFFYIKTLCACCLLRFPYTAAIFLVYWFSFPQLSNVIRPSSQPSFLLRK